ncbi:MAG: phosphatidylinositol mannoside acyltransferase [Acidimicrobiales bacterium]|nr:phosphatidylinositol mannoside acyltransferase [Acidimicrobiales bacterium]
MVDLITSAFKTASGLARIAPGPMAGAAARSLGRVAARTDADRRQLVARNLQRADPSLQGPALQRAVRQTFESYARYWVESFRLPTTSPEALEAGFTYEGYEHIDAARAAGKGAVMALPHLGGWEWAAFWLTRVRGVPVTAVVERLEPDALFEWFVELRESLGMTIVPLGPEAGTATARALRDNNLLALLCDRDIAGNGIEVEFFGERTTLPGGPAVLALRSGAPILPTAIYFEGSTRHAVVRAPLDTSRQGSLREDIQRVTQDVAHALEELIRVAPEQWHLLQPNWPSDRP